MSCRVISLDYKAKELGVKKHMNAREVKSLSSTVKLVHVDTIPFSSGGSKADLSYYRMESRKVFAILRRFVSSTDVLRRVSLDEAYFDFTRSLSLYGEDVDLAQLKKKTKSKIVDGELEKDAEADRFVVY